MVNPRLGAGAFSLEGHTHRPRQEIVAPQGPLDQEEPVAIEPSSVGTCTRQGASQIGEGLP